MTLTKQQKDELACTYAALILHDENIAIDSDKIKKLVKAAGVEVESYWPVLFAKFLQKNKVSDLLKNVGSAPAAAPAAAQAAPADKKDEKKDDKKDKKKKEEEPPAEEEDMGFGALF